MGVLEILMRLIAGDVQSGGCWVMARCKWVVCAAAIAVSVSAWGGEIALYASGEGDCDEALVREINAARERVRIRANAPLGEDVLSALEKALEREVEVEVILVLGRHFEGPKLRGHLKFLLSLSAEYEMAWDLIALIDDDTVVTGRFVEAGYNLIVRRGFPALFRALSKEHEKHREQSFCEIAPGVYGGDGFDRADIPGPRVGVEPFKEEKGWNETEQAGLMLGKAITWAVRSRLVEGAATPVSIPSDTLRRLCPGYEESSAKMSDEEYELIEGLDYALSNVVEKLAVTEIEATLSVTYQVFRKTRNSA